MLYNYDTEKNVLDPEFSGESLRRFLYAYVDRFVYHEKSNLESGKTSMSSIITRCDLCPLCYQCHNSYSSGNKLTCEQFISDSLKVHMGDIVQSFKGSDREQDTRYMYTLFFVNEDESDEVFIVRTLNTFNAFDTACDIAEEVAKGCTYCGDCSKEDLADTSIPLYYMV